MVMHQPLGRVKDQLITFLDEGFGVLGRCFQNGHDTTVSVAHDTWVQQVAEYLRVTFPTAKELGQFLYTPGMSVSYNNTSPEVSNTIINVDKRLKVLESVLDKLTDYYEFSIDRQRIYIQDIDSFSKVRGVNTDEVQPYLKNGFLNVSEEQVKQGLVQIIGQSYIPKDWGGETEDIYTSHILLNGQRVQASIILKGPGTVKSNRETQLGNLGKNGDQLDRMFRSPSSELFIIQSVKPFAQNVVNTAEAHIQQKRSQNSNSHYCIIDGQDTAMLLFAYNLLDDSTRVK